MEPNFNINRPKVSDEEINQHKDFDQLVKQFKEKSLKQAQGDESWWKNKKVRYTAVIAGVTVICTISYNTLFKKQHKADQRSLQSINQLHKNETLITSTKSDHNKKTGGTFITAPSQNLKVPYSSYKINNAKGGAITHHTASKINIPKNSFVNKAGKEVIGDVTIEYREFHDFGDIIVSGIPMAYDSAASHFNLESAGMFDIRGSQNGEPVFIRPEKSIQVELASTNNESRFKQYFLDTVAKNWKYIKKDDLLKMHPKTNVEEVQFDNNTAKAVVKSPKLSSLKKQIEIVIPGRIDSVKTVYTKRTEQLPKVKEPSKPAQPTKGRPTFKLDGSYSEFPELAALNNVIFEVGPENTNYTNELHETTWSDVKVTQGPVKGKNYVLLLSYRNRSEKLIVYPVLTGADYTKAQKLYENKFSEYEALVEKRNATEQKLLAEMQAKQESYLAELKKKQKEYELERAKLLSKYQMEQQNEISSSFNTMSNSTRAMRLFSISQFGIFNSDCPHAIPQGASVNPTFVLNTNKNTVVPDYIYLIDHSTKSVYQLSASNGFSLIFKGGNPYSICVFKQNQLYLCGKNDFEQAVAAGEHKFIVRALPKESENLPDFKKALEL